MRAKFSYGKLPIDVLKRKLQVGAEFYCKAGDFNIKVLKAKGLCIRLKSSTKNPGVYMRTGMGISAFLFETGLSVKDFTPIGRLNANLN